MNIEASSSGSSGTGSSPGNSPLSQKQRSPEIKEQPKDEERMVEDNVAAQEDEEIKKLHRNLLDANSQIKLITEGNEFKEVLGRLYENDASTVGKGLKNVMLSWSVGTSIKSVVGVASQSDLSFSNPSEIAGDPGNYQFVVPVTFDSPSNSSNGNGNHGGDDDDSDVICID